MITKGGFKLIIAEKPDAARRIANALGDSIVRAPKRGELPLYEVTRNGDRIKVMAALGHLYTLKQVGKGWNYPVENMEWVPKYEARKAAENARFFIDKFHELSLEASSFIVATDYDVEGEIIAYCILRYACGENALRKAERMKFSTLTDNELAEAYEHRLPHIDFHLAEAGETRHKVDWLFGINISRALILAVKNSTGRYRTLSTGRVQGPTLTFVAEREAEIRSFVPLPYWTINAQVEISGKVYPLVYSRERVPDKKEAERVVGKCQGKMGTIMDIEKRLVTNLPPFPFDLGSLQTEAYRLFGFTPSKTLSIAERLYLAAVISYPRTSSQKIPPSLEPRRILEPLMRIPQYENLISDLLKRRQLVPNQGKKEDPAHPPITPTGVVPDLGKLLMSEQKLFDLIVKRFMAIYGDPATSESVRAAVDVDGELFYLRGRKVVDKGWSKFYEPYIRSEEMRLPELGEGQQTGNCRVNCKEKFTTPPPRYNPSTLLRLMEEHEIGTKATRADIIDTLSRRGYVEGEPVAITELGFGIIDILRRYSPQLLSVETTRQLEQDMERIRFGELEEKEVLSKTILFLRPVLERIKSMESAIGKSLEEALLNAARKSRAIGRCPVCGDGELVVIRSKKTGKRFVGCTSYQNGKCKYTAPLPQMGTLQASDKKCGLCGFPTVVVRIAGRRPWQLCVNTGCAKNQRKPDRSPDSKQAGVH